MKNLNKPTTLSKKGQEKLLKILKSKNPPTEAMKKLRSIPRIEVR